MPSSFSPDPTESGVNKIICSQAWGVLPVVSLPPPYCCYELLTRPKESFVSRMFTGRERAPPEISGVTLIWHPGSLVLGGQAFETRCMGLKGWPLTPLSYSVTGCELSWGRGLFSAK